MEGRLQSCAASGCATAGCRAEAMAGRLGRRLEGLQTSRIAARASGSGRLLISAQRAGYRPTRQRRDRPFIKDRNRAKLGFAINDEIEYPEVRLLDEDKEMIGIMPTQEAMERASDAGVDLILVSTASRPPVCRLMEWTKYKFILEKEQKEKKKKQRESRIELKELKMRPGTDTHDYNVRLKKAAQEIEKGNKIRLVCQFRGRENQFADQGFSLFQRFMEDLGENAVVERKAQKEGRLLTMIIGPTKKS